MLREASAVAKILTISPVQAPSSSEVVAAAKIVCREKFVKNMHIYQITQLITF